MNYKTRNWLDRFSAFLFVTPDEGVPGEEAGAGGAEPIEQAAEPVDAVDLTSTDPAEITRFPKGTKISEDQTRSLLGLGAKNNRQPKDPTVEQDSKPAPLVPKGKEQAGAAKPDPKAPVFDDKIKRWRDPDTKAIVAAPKGAKAAPGAAPPVPPVKTPEEKIAEAIAKGFEKIQPALVPTPDAPDSKNKDVPQHFYGGLTPSLSIPDEIHAMLDSDDPVQRKQALGVVINGTANAIMKDVTAAFPHLIRAAVEQAVSQSRTTGIQSKNATDLYGIYPQLNSDLLHPAVDSFGRQLAAQWEQQGWRWQAPGGGMSREFIDAVAIGFADKTGISLNLPGEGGQAEEVVVEQVKQPFFNRGSRARPPAAGAQLLKSADIMGVVNSRG